MHSNKQDVFIYSAFHSIYYFYIIDNNLYEYVAHQNTIILGNSKVYQLNHNELFDDWMKKHKHFQFFKFIKKAIMFPGCYFQRISWNGINYQLVNQIKATQSYEAGNMLMKKLNDIFLTVYPTSDNDKVYGHEIRALLLLSCMEVENNFISILKDNGYIKDRYTTSDFIKLKDYLNLEEYEVKLKFYPEYPSIKPFMGWNNTQPTKSLYWYNAYNMTKHNREENFKDGNLEYAVMAIAGLAALLSSQFFAPIVMHNIEGISVLRAKYKPEQTYIPHPNKKDERINLEL